MDYEFIVRGILFAAAMWVGYACVKRLNLMNWREHAPLLLASYILIALWAGSYVLGIVELQPFGIIGVALLFWAGRRRWLEEAPEETLRACAPCLQEFAGPDIVAEVRSRLHASKVMPDPHRDRIEAVLQEMEQRP